MADERPADAMVEHAAKLAPAAREKNRQRRRAEYVRQHAPTIFAGLCADGAKWSTWDVQITVAVEIAGLLFDETESSDG